MLLAIDYEIIWYDMSLAWVLFTVPGQMGDSRPPPLARLPRTLCVVRATQTRAWHDAGFICQGCLGFGEYLPERCFVAL
jgi:hypothetical protein